MCIDRGDAFLIESTDDKMFVFPMNGRYYSATFKHIDYICDYNELASWYESITNYFMTFEAKGKKAEIIAIRKPAEVFNRVHAFTVIQGNFDSLKNIIETEWKDDIICRLTFKNCVKELTVAQIEEKLGYKIKIVDKDINKKLENLL